MFEKKQETVVFGDFNFDTLIDSNSRSDYEKLLYAFDLKQQKYQPTNVWIISSQASKCKCRQFPQQLVNILMF